MKTIYFSLALLLAAVFYTPTASAQVLAPNQNPNYAVSRDKYMRLADSITRWHSTTLQNTYSAPDWYEQRMQRREERRDFRREWRANWYRGYSVYPDYRWHEPYYPFDGYYRYRHYRPFWYWHH